MKTLRIVIAVAVLLGGGWWLYTHPETLSRWSEVKDAIRSQTADLIPADIQKSISLSDPLRRDEGRGAALTRAGVVRYTNEDRAANGALPPLKASSKLDQVAALRMKDMFEHQYFAHESPSGKDAEYGAKEYGYVYLSLAENIALGRFDGDRDLVTAWMNSPGHRKNILSTKNTEIGVAVGEGTFEGRKVWIGVQIFGRPASDCPQPSAELKARIASARAELDALAEKADVLRAELERAPRPRNQAERDAYNAKVDAYNALVAGIERIDAEIRTLIGEYNAQVERTNACIGA